MTRDKILSVLDKVEHPEIAVSLVKLGMILDVAPDEKTLRIALSLPRPDIPAAVLKAISDLIKNALNGQGLDIQMEYFDMTPDDRERFFALAKANWKGSI